MSVRYPFTPALLDALPEELAELYRDLEARLLREICSRLNAAGELNEVTLQDIRALRSHGVPLDQITGAVRRTTGIGERKLQALLEDVTARNQRYYTELADAARVTVPDRLVDMEDVYAVYEQTRTEYRNITQSLGFLIDNGRRLLPPGSAYRWALDRAELQVLSGTGSYNQAIRDAVLELADSGLKTVSFESGHVDQADVAVRRAVMTGVNQLCQKYADQSMDYLGTDLVEVSAHSGARDVDGPKGWENHKAWQGKVYRWNRPDHPRTGGGAYPDFEASCGYGDVQGIEGANCRHHYSPFIEGVMERTYTDEQLANIDPPPFTYEGRTYTAYQATQKQRQIERTIRKLKRKRDSAKAAGLDADADAAQIKIRRLSEKYREFSQAAGLPEQRERMKVYEAKKVEMPLANPADSGIMGGMEEKAVPVTEQARRVIPHQELYGPDAVRVDLDYINSNEYRMKFHGITGNPVVDDRIAEQCRMILESRSGTYKETLVILDADNGSLLGSIDNSTDNNHVSYDEKANQMLTAFKKRGHRLLTIHNHPTGYPPTADDCASARQRGYSLGVVCGHNGAVYTYAPSGRNLTSAQCDAIHDEIALPCQFMTDPRQQVKEWLRVLHHYKCAVEEWRLWYAGSY